MTVELAIAGAAVAVSIIAVVFVVRGGSAARRRLADRIAKDIEPYLRRKAAEAGLAETVPVWTARNSPDEVLAFSAELAQQLLAQEKAQLLGTSSTALAHTLDARSDDAL